VLIQRFASHRWITIKRIKASQHAVFFVPLGLRGPALLRARLGSIVSLAWHQS
jgi:hypothetical protein